MRVIKGNPFKRCSLALDGMDMAAQVQEGLVPAIVAAYLSDQRIDIGEHILAGIDVFLAQVAEDRFDVRIRTDCPHWTRFPT